MCVCTSVCDSTVSWQHERKREECSSLSLSLWFSLRESLFWNMHERECSVSLFCVLWKQLHSLKSKPPARHHKCCITCIIRGKYHMQRLKTTQPVGHLLQFAPRIKSLKCYLVWFCCGCHSRSIKVEMVFVIGGQFWRGFPFLHLLSSCLNQSV